LEAISPGEAALAFVPVWEFHAMSFDKFAGRAKSSDGPSDVFTAVAPDDAADLPLGLTRALFVGDGGVFSVHDADGRVVSFASNDAQYHPLRVRRVLETGTTAAGIVALY
jgi:hypothetical protein